MTLRPKNHKKIIIWYILLAIVLISGISFVSYLLFDKIGGKSWEEIKTIIVASIIAYLGWLQLAYRLILDVVLYTRKFKSAKNGVIHVIESPSAYKPKQAKKVVQNKEIKTHMVEKKLGDNLIRITDKDIVIVYGKTFETQEDYYKSIQYTLGEIQEEIRKKMSDGI